MTGYRYANNQDHVDKRMAMLLILCSARVKIDADNSVTIRRLDHNVMDLDCIYGPTFADRISKLPIQEVLFSLERTRPVSSTSSVEQVASRFEGELLNDLPVIESSTKRFVGVISRVAVLEALHVGQKKLPIRESTIIALRIHSKLGELLDAMSEQLIASVDLCNGYFHIVQLQELGWRLARVVKERIVF